MRCLTLSPHPSQRVAKPQAIQLAILENFSGVQWMCSHVQPCVNPPKNGVTHVQPCVAMCKPPKKWSCTCVNQKKWSYTCVAMCKTKKKELHMCKTEKTQNYTCKTKPKLGLHMCSHVQPCVSIFLKKHIKKCLRPSILNLSCLSV